MSNIEPFIMSAKSNTGIHKEDKSLMLIGAEIDESIKWVNVPNIGRRNVLSIKKIGCSIHGCSKNHNEAYLGEYKGKNLYMIKCTTVGEFIVYTKERIK